MAQTSTDLRTPRRVQIQASFTRPSNTTAYTAKDAVGTSPAAYLTFANAAAKAGLGGRVVGATIGSTKDSPTNCVLDLILFDSAPTPTADNDEMDLLAADLSKIVGHVPFAATDFGEAKDTKYGRKQLEGEGLGFVTGSANALYGMLRAGAAYTPGDGEVITVTLDVIQE